MNIRCIAIDDEPLALRQLASYLGRVPFFDVVASCQSALDAMRLMESEPVDVLFIDINMPDLNGLDFVRSLAQPPLVVFTTAYSEYALDGYKVEAVDYLLKPFGMGDVMAAANKVKHRYDLMHTATVSSIDQDDAIFLKTEYKVVRILIPQILYVEGMSEYLRIHLSTGQKPIMALLSMKKMEERLAARPFMRVHKSYIINLHHIMEINRSHVILDDNTEIPIGDSFRDSLNGYVANKFLTKTK